MFGKLLKYEFKSLGKWYLSLYAIALFLSAVIGFWIRNLSYRNANTYSSDLPLGGTEGWFFAVTIFAFALLIAGLLISTFFLVVSRFYKNIYGRQGYLTMALPVNSHQLILSKLVASLVWYFLASLVTILSIFIIIGINADIDKLIQTGIFNSLSQAISLQYGNILLFFFQLFIESVSGILLSYFAISLGQLFSDHRVLLAVVFYIGLSFVIGIFHTTVNLTTFGAYQAAQAGSSPNFLLVATGIVTTVVFYFGTHFIMTKKLNLQ